jgi:hypothetical protein
MSVVLSHLLSAGFFPDQVVFATEQALNAVVSSVSSAPGPREVAEASPFSLVVVGHALSRAGDVSADLAIRLAAQRGAAGLVLRRSPDPLPPATRSLAERTGVALVLVDHHEPGRLVPAMDHFVRAAADVGSLSVVTHRLHSAGGNPEDMVRVLASTLRHPVGLVGPTGRVLAGDLPAAALSADGLAERLAADRPVPAVRSAGEDDLLVTQPIQLVPGGPANLWLVALVPSAPAARARVTGQVLDVATWAFVAHLAMTAVRLERQGRRDEVLLTCLLDEADAPHPSVLEQVTAVGWRVGGWHTGIHVMARGEVRSPPAVRDRLRECLRAHGLPAEPIGHGDGWSMWTTADTEPDAERTTALLRSVRRVLLDTEQEYPGLRLCAGVGSADEGTTGLRRSLREAQRSSLLAAARNAAGAVEHIGTDDVKRLLSNRYTTNLQYDLAHRLLRPLTAVDTGGQLVHTLSCYLDNESSATATAAALGVHRNTVLQRLDRIRSLLAVRFTDADERLALHLAIRLVLSAPAKRAAYPDDEPPPLTARG